MAHNPRWDCQYARVYRNLQKAREEAARKNGYDSTRTRSDLKSIFRDRFGKDPYEWQLDVTEAILLGLDSVVHHGHWCWQDHAIHDVSASQWHKKGHHYFSAEDFASWSGAVSLSFSWINTEGIQVYLAGGSEVRWLLTWWIGAQLSLEFMLRMLILIHNGLYSTLMISSDNISHNWSGMPWGWECVAGKGTYWYQKRRCGPDFVTQWGVPEMNRTRCSRACSAQLLKNSELISHNMP